LKNCGATLLALGIGVTSKLAHGPVLLTRWVRETGGQLVFFSSENELKKNLRTAMDAGAQPVLGSLCPDQPHPGWQLSTSQGRDYPSVTPNVTAGSHTRA
jgi:hypothetical protein